jgi:hypothetical protein
MNATSLTSEFSTSPQPSWVRFAQPALRGAVSTWLVVALIGQLLFAFYVASYYGRTAWLGRVADWNKVMPHGHVAGDTAGNSLVALHLVFTVLVVLGGVLQLWPQWRQRAPTVHRWVGRLYVLGAVTLSLTGLVMLLTRGTVGGTAQHVAIAFNAVLILVFATMAWRHALARRIDAHRRFALRLFVAVSGVWFFRIGLMFWLIANRGPVGFDMKTFQGPALVALAFGQTLVPLAVLQLYLHVQEKGGPAARLGVAGLLALLTAVTAAGVSAAFMFMWLPRL